MSFSLDDKAKQTEFAKLVGISQPAVSQKIDSGVLPRDGSYADWIFAYCGKLREEAAGRGGDAQSNLTEARTAEAVENMLAKRYERLQREKLLILIDDIEPLITSFFAATRQNFESAGAQIIEAIESKHKIELNDDDVQQPLRDSLRATAAAASEFFESGEASDQIAFTG